MKKYKTHIVWVVVAIAALTGGYFWGKATGVASRTGGSAAAGTFNPTRRFAGGMAGGEFISGQIATMDSSSITLQLANGSSRILFYSSSTPVSEPTMVPVGTLKPGMDIMAGGTANSDGSMVAQTIQVRVGGAGGGSAPAGAGQ